MYQVIWFTFGKKRSVTTSDELTARSVARALSSEHAFETVVHVVAPEGKTSWFCDGGAVPEQYARAARRIDNREPRRLEDEREWARPITPEEALAVFAD